MVVDGAMQGGQNERKAYPVMASEYKLLEEVGQGVSATVYRALCIPFNEVVAVKCLDLEKCISNLDGIRREAQMMSLISHPNVVKAYCSFVVEQSLWVVMPYMAGGSCLHIMKSAYPDGFDEPVIAIVLKEALKALDYLHRHGHIHRDVKAGNILVDANGAIKLGDFGVSACMFDTGDRQRSRNTFVGTPCWMAPEVMEQLHGYDFKADIWSFGITALELAHGHAPFSKYPPMKVLLMTLQNAPPGLDYERDKRFSKSFKEMIGMCLVKDPAKRPSAEKLLKHSFFKQARNYDYMARHVLCGMPPLGERVMNLKIKEAARLAQKKMPYGEQEERSQNEYKRGVSSWNFNIEDMKAQAAMIRDDDDIAGGKEEHVEASKPRGQKVSENGADTLFQQPVPSLTSSVSEFVSPQLSATANPSEAKATPGSGDQSAPVSSQVQAKISNDPKFKPLLVGGKELRQGAGYESELASREDGAATRSDAHNGQHEKHVLSRQDVSRVAMTIFGPEHMLARSRNDEKDKRIEGDNPQGVGSYEGLPGMNTPVQIASDTCIPTGAKEVLDEKHKGIPSQRVPTGTHIYKEVHDEKQKGMPFHRVPSGTQISNLSKEVHDEKHIKRIPSGTHISNLSKEVHDEKHMKRVPSGSQISNLCKEVHDEKPMKRVPSVTHISAVCKEVVDEKHKGTVVQKKGRFSITSEEIDSVEKVPHKGLAGVDWQSDKKPSVDIPTEKEREHLQQISELQSRVADLLEELRVVKLRNIQLEQQLNFVLEEKGQNQDR